MAWYYGKFNCGHDGRVNIIGPEKDRQWKADNEFEGLCEDCYKKDREEAKNRKSDEARKFAEKHRLPELKGTEKQIAWANIIRFNFINHFSKATKEDWRYFFIHNDIKPTMTISVNNIKRTVQHIALSVDSAKEYIESNHNWSGLILKYFPIVIQPEKTDEEKQLEKEVREEATVFPSKIDNHLKSPVEIKENAGYIDVESEKDETIIKIVKSLHYRWNNDKRVWHKKITEFTESISDRIAELGNKLLNKGFPITIFDEESRNKAVNGNFESECFRWIAVLKNEDAFKIFFYDNHSILFDRAYSLPYAKRIRGGIKVRISYYKEVMDFVEQYGFKISKFAIKAIENYKILVEKNTVNVAVEKETKDKDGLQEILESSDDVLDDLKD